MKWQAAKHSLSAKYMGGMSKDKEQLMLESTFGMTKYTSGFSFPSPLFGSAFILSTHHKSIISILPLSL